MKGMKRGRYPDGTIAQSGLWEHPDFKVELENGLWRLWVKLSCVVTGIYEYSERESARDIPLGLYETISTCHMIVERLKSGNYMWRTGYIVGDVRIRASLVLWADIKDEVLIRQKVD